MADDERRNDIDDIRHQEDGEERDPFANDRSLPRVAEVITHMVPVYHEPPEEPVHSKTRVGVQTRLIPMLRSSPRAGMATMSDLGLSGTRSSYPQHVARNPKPTPTAAAADAADKTKPKKNKKD